MNSQSSYVYEGPSSDEGLGRLSLQPVAFNRFIPATDPTAERIRSIRQLKPRTMAPKPIVRPRPRPVVDRNSAAAPRLDATAIRKAARKRAQQTATKPNAASQKKAESQVKKQISKASGSGGFLDGTISIGGVQIEKKHAAIGGGATMGAALLFKLLL